MIVDSLDTSNINKNLIALVGKARTGKDTFGGILVMDYGYTRLSIAESLRTIAAHINPYIGDDMRYVEALDTFGYEDAKTHYPEVRLYLQRLGDALRTNIGPDVFLQSFNTLLEKADGPIVVTDCRLPLEANFLRAKGFTLVHLDRVNTVEPGLNSQHATEAMVDQIKCDVTVDNNGSIDDLKRQIATLLK